MKTRYETVIFECTEGGVWKCFGGFTCLGRCWGDVDGFIFTPDRTEPQRLSAGHLRDIADFLDQLNKES